MFNYMPSDNRTKIFPFLQERRLHGYNRIPMVEQPDPVRIHIYIFLSLSLSSNKISVFKSCYNLEKKIVFNYLITRLLMSLLQFTSLYRSDDSSNESTVEPEDENLVLYIYIYTHLSLSLKINKYSTQ